jgi:hypothetical protein
MLRALPIVCLLTTPAYATEPPCHIPSCMGGQITGAGKERVVLTSADGKLEVRIVATTMGPRMVLVEIVRDKAVEKVQAVFVIQQGSGVELVPFGGDLAKPILVFAGDWRGASKLGGIDVAPSKLAVDGRAVFTRYQTQQRAEYADGQKRYAKTKLDENVAELNKACGTSITATQDFSRVPDAWFETSMRDPEYVCEDNFHGIVVNRCDSAAGKQAVAQKLKTVKCVYKPAGALSMKLDNGTLTIELSLSANRERQGSQAQRYLQPKL